MTGRLRVILPPAQTLLAFALIYAVMEGPFVYVRWRFGLAPGNQLHPGVVLVKFAAALYGAYRVAGFQPFYRMGYREWLELTPWTSASPLPVGPAHLVWEDAVVVGGIALLSLAQPLIDPVRVVCLVLLSSSAFLTLTFWPTGVPAFGYAAALAGGLAVRLYPDRWAHLAASAATYAIAVAGLRASLARFPWPLGWQKDVGRSSGRDSIRLDYWNGPPCGWPYDQLRPPPPPPVRLGRLDAWLVSMLAGWWLYAAEALCEDPRERLAVATFTLVGGTVGLVVGRFLVYRLGYAPPISLWGRIATMRWLIPGYDQLYFGPACATAVAVFGYRALRSWDLDDEVSCPVVLAAVLLVTLTAPPGLVRWRLTGRHRLAFTALNQQNRSEFTRVG